jgi:5'-3' exonuclease
MAKVHLVDGTYELFRQFFGRPAATNDAGEEVAAVRGVLQSMLSLLADGATHVGVATDHVIESFRNDRWPGYKTGAGVPPPLLAQFPLLEEALSAMGVVVWAMVEYEADDALAAAAACAAADPDVEQVVICTPDKDLAQCVTGRRVVQLDRRSGTLYDEEGVRGKFGVPPPLVPDWLGLVGDSADGFPGLPGFGAKTAAILLAAYGHLDAIPTDASDWPAGIRGAANLAKTLADQRDDALLFRQLATLRDDCIAWHGTEALRWRGPTPEFPAVARRLGSPALVTRAAELAAGRPR